jgi:hypothetical protein
MIMDSELEMKENMVSLSGEEERTRPTSRR